MAVNLRVWFLIGINRTAVALSHQMHILLYILSSVFPLTFHRISPSHDECLEIQKLIVVFWQHNAGSKRKIRSGQLG